MTADYGGVVVEWTDKEAEKIAEIRARKQREPQSSTIAEDIKRRAHRLERDLSIILLRKTTSLSYPQIADLYGMKRNAVEAIVRRAREGNYDSLGFWFCGNVEE